MNDLFPLLYHAQHSSYTEDLPFWLDLAAQSASPALELGCGTGRVLLPIARQVGPVFGLDRSAGMLALLRQHTPPELEPRVHVWLGDLRVFRLAARFGLIYLPCNTISTLTSAERRQVFTLARRHLAPHGLFAASLPNPAFLAHLPASSEPEVEDAFKHPIDGEPVQVLTGWSRTSDTFTVSYHYDHLLPNGQTQRLSVQSQHSLDGTAAYQSELQAAGYTHVEVFGDFDRRPYRRSSPNLVFIAQLSD